MQAVERKGKNGAAVSRRHCHAFKNKWARCYIYNNVDALHSSERAGVREIAQE